MLANHSSWIDEATHLNGVTHLAAIAVLDLGVVPRLMALLGEMTLLLAVAACDGLGVAGLIALLGHVIS